MYKAVSVLYTVSASVTAGLIVLYKSSVVQSLKMDSNEHDSSYSVLFLPLKNCCLSNKPVCCLCFCFGSISVHGVSHRVENN